MEMLPVFILALFIIIAIVILRLGSQSNKRDDDDSQ